MAVDGSYNGASAIGRLGNEGNGGEFQLSKAFKGENGAIWDINVMIDHWGDEVNLKKAYAGVTNIMASNPNAYFWAGRDFHQRPQQGINDYFWMNHDGQGAGVKNFDIGGVQFDVAAVAAVESCSPEVMEDEANPSRITCTGGSGTGDKGNYAATSKIHGMKLGPLDLELYANYGFDSKAVESDERLNAWQGGVVLSHTNDSGVNKVIARYSDNSDNSVFNKTEDLTTVYASFEGLYKFTRPRRWSTSSPSTTTTTAVIRPTTVRTTTPSCARCTGGTTFTPPGWKRAGSTWITTTAATTRAGS